MTRPPLVVTTADGIRHYQHPETKDLYPSVTAVLDVKGKGFGLVQSAANNTARAAYKYRQALQAIPDENAAVGLLKYMYKDYWGEKADLGSDVHEVCEALWRKVEPPRVAEDRRPYINQFLEFAADFRPEWVIVEATVFNERYKYAGTFDFVMRIDDVLVLGDHKTGKAVYPEVGLQLAALRYAERVWARNTGELGPMPHVDACVAVHLGPTGYKVHTINADGAAFEAFLGLRQALPWTKSDRSVVGPVVTRERLLRAIEVTPQGLIHPPLAVVAPESKGGGEIAAAGSAPTPPDPVPGPASPRSGDQEKELQGILVDVEDAMRRNIPQEDWGREDG